MRESFHFFALCIGTAVVVGGAISLVVAAATALGGVGFGTWVFLGLATCGWSCFGLYWLLRGE